MSKECRADHGLDAAAALESFRLLCMRFTRVPLQRSVQTAKITGAYVGSAISVEIWTAAAPFRLCSQR
jgi:hypothetical protein